MEDMLKLWERLRGLYGVDENSWNTTPLEGEWVKKLNPNAKQVMCMMRKMIDMGDLTNWSLGTDKIKGLM